MLSRAGRNPILTGVRVAQAMRRQVIRIGPGASLGAGLRRLIKFKLGALLVGPESGSGIGVLSRSDLMTAFYAGLDLKAPVESIMVSPPETIPADSGLETALDKMRASRIHRLYATGPDGREVVGVLAYADIVGLIFRFCADCARSTLGRGAAESLPVSRVMTPEVVTYWPGDSLAEVMEGLAAARLGAVLIADPEGAPAGVLSKADLLLAYQRGLGTDLPARKVMSAPAVVTSHREELLVALHRMIFADLSRLFVCGDDPREVVGVLSLTDVARFSSGSCRACVAARIEISKP